MAAVAIGGYIASLVKQGESIPVDDETLSTMVEVDVPAEVSRG